MKFTTLMIILLMILVLNLFVVVKVIQHIEKFSNDPLVYGAIAHNITTCQCIMDNGKDLSFNKTSVNKKIKIQKYEEWGKKK